MSDLSPIEISYLEKLKKILSTIDSYDHIQTMLKYVDYINNNDMYSFKYRYACSDLIRSRAYELRNSDLKHHYNEIRRINHRYQQSN